MRRPALIESAESEPLEEYVAPVQQQPSPSPAPQNRPAQKRRRSSMADLTGRLLMDDSEEGLAMLAPPGSKGGMAPPSSPQDSPAARGAHAGRHRQQCLPLCTLSRDKLKGVNSALACYCIAILVCVKAIAELCMASCREGHDNRAAARRHLSAS